MEISVNSNIVIYHIKSNQLEGMNFRRQRMNEKIKGYEAQSSPPKSQATHMGS